MLKITCEKAFLQSAVSVTSRAVATKSSIPALEGILLEADQLLTLSGYNMQTGIRTAVEADIVTAGRVVLNARLFGDIIRKLPDDMVVLTVDDKLSAHISCGDADFDIPALSADDYPEMPQVDDERSISIQQGVLKQMIRETSFAVSTNEARPIHTGCLFEITEQGLTVVAVDGFRLALRCEPLEKIEGGDIRFVAPGSALKEVENICDDTDDLVRIIQGKRHLQFLCGNTELICRRLEGEFLDYKNAIPKNNPIQLLVEKKALLNSLDRVSVVISEKLKSPVKCRFSYGKVLLSAKTGNGEAKDVCALSGDGKDLEIGFNNRYLMDALRNAPAEEVTIQLNTGISPCIITPTDDRENFLYMVLPVRLKA